MSDPQELNYVRASDALVSARSAESAMARKAMSVRWLLALAGLVIGVITISSVLPWPWRGIVLFTGLAGLVAIVAVRARTRGMRLLIVEYGTRVGARIALLVLAALVPLAAVVAHGVFGPVWPVIASAILSPLALVVVPWWWESSIRRAADQDR